VVASLGADYSTTVLSLTILFHPHTGRIGESWEHPLSAQTLMLEIGRHQPEFGLHPETSAPSALDDPHISRQALRLEVSAKAVQLHKYPGACRCKVQGRELKETIDLEASLMSRGVTLQLGHGVVLWMRLGASRQLPGSTAAIDTGALAMLGNSACMVRLRQQIARAAATDLDVLVLGETGTGKELTAAALHETSARTDRPFVPINMSAIPVALAPALLFGSTRGAYTGAVKASEGYFQQAHHGTLFMDEVGDTPEEIQPQLLRVLQQRQVQIVGGSLQSVDLRVIAATDVELESEDCHFSAALRHRLGAVEIRVPALRDHPEDIGELLLHFLHEAAAEMGCEALLPAATDGDIRTALWAEVFQLFARYDWPGNIRELANAARQLMVASEHEVRVPEHLLQRLQQARANGQDSALRPMSEVGVDQFREAFLGNDYEVAATARALGVSRQSIYRRLDESPDLRLASDVADDELREALVAVDGDARQAARVLAVSYKGLRVRLRSSGML